MKMKKLLFISICAIFITACQQQNNTADLYQAQLSNTDGNPNGKVTLVEFYDFRCGACKKMTPVIKQVINDVPNVRVIYREYPVLGSLSEYAAKAALAAKMQDRYLAFRQLLMNSPTPLTQKNILNYASEAQMDPKLLAKDINSEFVKQQYAAIQNMAKQWGVKNTPTYFIGIAGHDPVKLVGYQSAKELEETINSQEN